MKTPREWAQSLSTDSTLADDEIVIAAAMADARRVALEECKAWLERRAHVEKDHALLLASRALLDSVACSCTITRHERQENRDCPVHFPAGAR